MKQCCREAPGPTKISLTSSTKLQMRLQVEALAAAGKHLEACEILKQLIVVSPRNPLIWNDLGIQYEASGQTEKAFDALRRGYQCDSTYPPILYNLGKFTLDRFINLGEAGELTPEEAQELLDKAIMFLNANLDRDPDNADAHYNLGLAYALGQDEQRATAHMTIALRMKHELEAPSGWRLR
jgi:tetratricopeptide (TPR) repeat protein